MLFQSRRRDGRAGAILVAATLLAVCDGADSFQAQSELLDANKRAFPVAPVARTGALTGPVRDALASVVPSLRERSFPSDAVRTMGESGDVRLLWYLYDLHRFAPSASVSTLVDAFEELSGTEVPGDSLARMGDRILAWGSAAAAELPAAQARSLPSHRASLGAVLR